MPDYQSIHLEDLLEQLEKADPSRELEQLEFLYAQRGIKEDIFIDYTSINSLLDIFSLLEIASMIRLVPTPLPDQVLPNLDAMFRSQPFRQFVFSDPRYIILASIIARALGEFSLHDGDQECLSTFFQFSILSSGFRQDEAVTEFCRLMRNHQVQESLDRILSSPNSLVEAITQSRASYSLLTFMTGLSRFLILCQDFNNLLKELDKYPLLQSTFWHHNARIIQTPGAEKVSRLLHKLEGWTELENSLLFQESPKNMLRNTSAAFEDLTGGLYQEELPRRVTEHTRITEATEIRPDISNIDEGSESSPSTSP